MPVHKSPRTNTYITMEDIGPIGRLRNKIDFQFRRLLQKMLGSFLFPVTPDWYISKGYDKASTDLDKNDQITNDQQDSDCQDSNDGNNSDQSQDDQNASSQNKSEQNASDQNSNDQPTHKAFNHFLAQQRSENGYFRKQFSGLAIHRDFVETKNCDGDLCEIEVCHFDPTEYLDANQKNPPGKNQHIVYFCGANTYYQGCFSDITTAAKETGATVHAFNYMGTGSSTGRAYEFNDLVNCGIAVVNSLMKQGIHPDSIVLQGDCYGSAIAHAVKMQYQAQCDTKLRIIVNNAFKSFKAAINDLILSSRIPNFLTRIVKKLLSFTGWNAKLGKHYKLSDPHQCYVQHIDDQTLQSAKLSYKVQKSRLEAKTNSTTSTKRPPVQDTCPEEYRAHRDELDRLSVVHVKRANAEKLGNKFGRNHVGLANSHFADLNQCEMLDGTGAYEGFVNKYLDYSNQYIQNGHQQTPRSIKELPTFLKSSAKDVAFSQQEREDLEQLEQSITLLTK